MSHVLLRVGRAALWTMAGVGTLLTVVTVLPLVSWWSAWLAGAYSRPSGDTLIVLGQSLEGTPGSLVLDRSSYWLSEYAATAYRQGNFRRIILSGGGEGRDSGTPVASLMADRLQYHGIPADVIDIEVKSHNLREQGEFVKAMLNDQSGQKVVLASDYRMFRTSHAFKKLGIEALWLPLSDAKQRALRFESRWPVFLDLLKEQFQIAIYLARGWI